MIKINLAKDMSLAVPNETNMVMEASENNNKEVIIKVGTMFSLVIILFIYENMSVSSKKDELKQINKELATLNQKISKFGKVSEVVQKVTSKKKEIEGQIEQIRLLSQARLTQLKVLDALQSLMPDKTWLKGIVLEGTDLTLIGYSLNSDGIPLLIRALDESVFFKEIDVKTAAQEKTADGTFNKFEITCKLGGQI